MVRKQDQEHVKALLTEAITVLCKNGLGFESQLNIEALIGITLDKDEVFLVNINETVNARNTRVSSVIELSCEDVCHRDCPELEPQTQVVSRPKIGPASSKRPKAQKRKHSNSSGSDKPPELERITDTDSNSPGERGEPEEKRVYSGSSTDEEKKIQLKEINKNLDNKEQPKYEQQNNNDKYHDTEKPEGKSSRSKSQDGAHSKGSNVKHNIGNGDKHDHHAKEQDNSKQTMMEYPVLQQSPTDIKQESEPEAEISSTSSFNSSKSQPVSNIRSAHYTDSPPSIEDLKSASEQVAYLHTTETKLQAVQYAEVHGNRAAGRAFDVSEGTVRRWRRTKDQLIAEKTALI